MQDDSGGLDAETFSYCGGRSGGRVRAGRPVDGPKRARYRIGYDDRAGTGAGTHGHDNGTHGHDNGTCGDDIGACHHDAGDDPERPIGEEKEDGQDDAAAGDR
jgi:hypothetical protein